MSEQECLDWVKEDREGACRELARLKLERWAEEGAPEDVLGRLYDKGVGGQSPPSDDLLAELLFLSLGGSDADEEGKDE